MSREYFFRVKFCWVIFPTDTEERKGGTLGEHTTLGSFRLWYRIYEIPKDEKPSMYEDLQTCTKTF